MCKKCNVNVVYSGPVFSYPVNSLNSQERRLNMKKILQIEHNMLKIPTGRRQISWLFHERGRKVEHEPGLPWNNSS